MAVQLMKKGFAVGMLVDRLRANQAVTTGCFSSRRSTSAPTSVTEKLQQARNDVDEAIKICRELGDINWEIEACLTKGTLFRKEFGQQRKIYDDALKMCKDRQGPINLTIAKLYFNKGITYEDEAMHTSSGSTQNYGLAYDYYKKAYVVSRETLGAEHSKTVVYRGVLDTPTYKWFAERRHESIDSLDTNEVLCTL